MSFGKTVRKASWASVALLLLPPSVGAALVTENTRTWDAGWTLADLEEMPRGFEIEVNDSAITSITRVEVRLHLTGVIPGAGFASEMFVSLTRDHSTTAVLLNGVGVNDGNRWGYGYDGWNITLIDDAPGGDVHLAQPLGGLLTGSWQPDGRSLASQDSRDYGLEVFQGLGGNGIWRLNVADLELGGQMRLHDWSLVLSGLASDGGPVDPGGEIPEGSSGVWIATLLGAIGGRAMIRRQKCQNSRAPEAR